MESTTLTVDTAHVLKITTPYSDGTRRVACLECGHWEREDKQPRGMVRGEILHAKSCASRPQLPEVFDGMLAGGMSLDARRLQNDNRVTVGDCCDDEATRYARRLAAVGRSRPSRA